MRELIRLSLFLAFACAVCGALLALVGGSTAEARASADDARRAKAARSVLPAFDPAEAEISEAAEFGAFVLRKRSTGEFMGASIEGASPHGYAGEVRLAVGFDAEGKVVDFAVVAAHETPGLGAKIGQDKFRAGVRGRPFDSLWKVSGDGGDIDAVTSATISSRAAVEAVADASAKFKTVTALAAARKNGGLQ